MISTTKTSNRIWEIDFLRGLAIILMIIFHLIVDLKDFYGYDVDYLSGGWYMEGKLSAILFILLCGASSTLGKNSTRHGTRVFLWAMVLTCVTYFYNPQYYILFGILHFLGISLLTANFMKQFSLIPLAVISASSIGIGLLLAQSFTNVPYWFPLGLVNNTFTSLDFYPLFPWYGVFIFGMLLGKIRYGNRKRLSPCQASLSPSKFLASPKPVLSIDRILQLGQHSLVVYLVHQPILLALLYLFHNLILTKIQ